MKLHFKYRPWDNDDPVTAEELETAKSLVRDSIAELTAWLAELNG